MESLVPYRDPQRERDQALELARRNLEATKRTLRNVNALGRAFVGMAQAVGNLDRRVSALEEQQHHPQLSGPAPQRTPKWLAAVFGGLALLVAVSVVMWARSLSITPPPPPPPPPPSP